MQSEHYPSINSRVDLFSYYEEQMNRSYGDVLDSRHQEYESSFVKAYILEFDWNMARSLGTDNSEKAIIAAAMRNASVIPADLHQLDEEGLWHLSGTSAGQEIHVYLDTITDPDRRFWLAYSLNQTYPLDRFVDRLSKRCPAIDRAWLWQSLLWDIQGRGEYKGAGIEFDSARIDHVLGKSDVESSFKVQMTGASTKLLFDIIREEEELRNRSVLSRIRITYRPDSESNDQFATCDTRYDSKFTGRGNSFNAFNELVLSTRSLYRQKIRDIEDRFVLRYFSGDDKGFSIEGNPIDYMLRDRIPKEHLSDFVDVVFSGHPPYMLWGLPRNHGNSIEVDAVDLHTGSSLYFQVYDDMIRMYLENGACGNAVPRFLAILQRTFSKNVEVVDADDKPVL